MMNNRVEMTGPQFLYEISAKHEEREDLCYSSWISLSILHSHSSCSSSFLGCSLVWYKWCLLQLHVLRSLSCLQHHEVWRRGCPTATKNAQVKKEHSKEGTHGINADKHVCDS